MSEDNRNGTKLLTTDLPETDGLSDQQRVFKDEYLRCWNATEAARKARYACPANAGWRLLRNVQIQAAIKIELENYRVGVDHVLARLSEKANINLSDFIDEDGKPDVKRIREKGYLVKKYKANIVTQDDKQAVEHVEIELCDSDNALFFIGKHLAMFQPHQRADIIREVFSELSHEMGPLLNECIDPAKRQRFAQGMMELARKHGHVPREASGAGHVGILSG